MPSLKAFGHRWGIGSDDLVIPAALEAVSSSIWLATFGRIVYYQRLGVISTSLKGFCSLHSFYSVGFGLISANILLLACIIHNSFKGTIINTYPRRTVSKLLIGKIVADSLLVSLCAASVKFAFYTDQAEVEQEILQTFKSSAKGLVGLTVTALLVMWHVLTPWKRRRHSDSHEHFNLETDETAQSALRDTWNERFESLGRFMGLEGHHAINKVGNLFSAFFKGDGPLDMVTTDVIAALMIVEKEQTERVERLKAMPHSASESVLGRPAAGPVKPQAWMTVAEAAHYMKYAAGCYGWPMYIWSSRVALFGLLRVLVRSSISNWRYVPRQAPDYIVNDNRLLANTTVIKMVTGLKDEDFVLVSYHNKLFEVPFYVALDHEKESIVVSIRGTLSLEDILTDLCAVESEALPVPGLVGGTAHEGMLRAGQYIQRRLQGKDELGQDTDDGLLAAARRKMPPGKDYRLVIVGHSLGAGVINTLAILMRQDERYGHDLKAFAYSPPGGMLSLPAARYAEDFLCSVVVGDDVVSRLSLQALFDMKIKVLNVLKRADVSKHEVFGGKFRNLLFMALGVNRPDNVKKDPRPSWADNPEARAEVEKYQRVVEAAIEATEREKREHGPKFLGGCLMYVEEEVRPGACWGSDVTYQASFVRGDSPHFGEILLSKDLVAHHTPWSVLHALREMAAQGREVSVLPHLPS